MRLSFECEFARASSQQEFSSHLQTEENKNETSSLIIRCNFSFNPSLPSAGGGSAEAAGGAGGGAAGGAAKEGGVPERPGEAAGRPEEAGEGQGRRAEATRQDGGGPSGRGELT